ncbi:MAG: hypothetical protein JWP85_2372 [Rhodoglobus sp.]|nr:hypothetical protein [Rhodoglobus sp.]
MNARSRLLALAGLPLVLALAACTPPAPVPGPAPGGDDDAKRTVTATPTPEAEPLPEDALMLVTATATASTGARLDLRLVVHEPGAWNDDIGAPGADATVAWCEGEVDADVIAANSESFTRIEYSAEQVGDLAWPTDAPIWLHPSANYTSLAAVDGVAQVPFPAPAEPGDYVPHCLQTAILPGAGSGSVFAGANQDAVGRDGLEPLRFWSRLTYGFNNDFDSAKPPTIAFTDCETTITPLGETFGAPGAGWHEDFLEGSCIVGGMTGY